MNEAEQKIASGCIERIAHIWFDDNAIDRPFEKITALFQVLSVVAPYECCNRVHYLWLAYTSAEDEYLPRLSRYRWRLFGEGLKRLQELAQRFPEVSRA